MKKIKIIIFLFFITISHSINAQETKNNNFPSPIGVVNDFNGFFSDLQKEELTKIILDFESKTTNQIVVITIDKIEPFKKTKRYAVEIGNYWGVGVKEKNNGLTIVICNSCKEIGIATGTGTELILTDEICKEVIDKQIIPEFKKGNFFEGIKKGVLELINKWKE